METIAEQKKRVRARLRGQRNSEGKIILRDSEATNQLVADGNKLAEHRIKSAEESRRITHKDLSTIVG